MRAWRSMSKSAPPSSSSRPSSPPRHRPSTTATGRRQRVVVCAGLNTLSTYGAVVFLMSLGQAFSFRSHPGLARARAGKRWAVLLKVENTSNSTRTTATRSPIDPNQVAIEVVSVLTDADFTPPYVYRF